jgi:Tat protein translocase TatB subunit
MFGIGIPELILIAVVALVVVGPKNLPLTLRAVGRAIREFQKASRELREQAGFDEVVDEVTRPLREGLAGIESDVIREEEANAQALEYPEGGPDDYGALQEGASWYPEDLPTPDNSHVEVSSTEVPVAANSEEVRDG